MCRSMIDIQFADAEIRQGKNKDRKKETIIICSVQLRIHSSEILVKVICQSYKHKKWQWRWKRKFCTLSYIISHRVLHSFISKYSVHRISKTSNLWLAVTWTHVNGFWYFFGRNVTDKVSNHKTLYYATSNDLCFCTSWQNGETHIFHSNAVLVHCLNSTSHCLIAAIFLTHKSYAVVWLPKYCSECIQLGAVGGAWFRRKEVDSAAAVGLCGTHNAPVRCLLGFLFHKVMHKH